MRPSPSPRNWFTALRTLVLLCALWAGLVALASVAKAQNERLDLVSLYQGELRALGMGNAFGALARGESALLYNPAGLAQRNFDIKLDASLLLEGEKGGFFSDTLDLVSLGSPSSGDVQNYLSTYLGTEQRYRAQTFLNAVANLAAFKMGVGGGELSQTRYTFAFDDDGATPGALDADDHLRLVKQGLDLRVLSAAFALVEGQLLVGATLKSLTYERKTATETFANVIASADIDLPTSGATYNASAYDFGLIWRMEALPFLRASWSLTAYNYGGITLATSGASTLEVPGTFNVGLALNPELPWSPVHLLLAVEWEDATNQLRVRDSTGADHARSSTQRLHYGAELGLFETSTGNHLLNLRMGNHRGQATWGAEVNLFSSLRLVYARYGDDLGYDGQSDPHTYEAAQLTLGFAF